MKKRILSILLSVVLLFSFSMAFPAGAAETADNPPAEGESVEGESTEGESEDGESAEGESGDSEGESDSEGFEMPDFPERTEEDEARMALKQAFDPSSYEGVFLTAPDNDMHNDLMYSYLMDEDLNNVFAYSYGAEQNSIPKGIICDFSGDGIEDASAYVIQRAADESFTDPITVTGLTEKTYTFYNLLLGETFFWRAGTSVETLDASPVHEVTVADLPPRVIYVEGVDYYAFSIPSGTESYRFNEYSKVYKGIFERISKADESPVYLHCSSGADRTGIVTFILLTLCGVSYEDAATDYLFTNFTDEDVRLKESEFDNWYSRLDYFAGETKSEKAANWLRLKGVPDRQIERIKEIFVEGYTAPGYTTPEPTEEQLALAESQSIGLTGVINARQLGGYVTEDGRKVKDGVLIRSGALGSATEEDLQILTEKYDVKLIIDFRNERDAGRNPDPQVGDAVILTVPVWDENINAVSLQDFMSLMAEFGDQPGRSDIESIRRGYIGADPDLYIKQNFQSDISIAGFRQFFDLLLEQEEDTGIIFHCSSGKDRTGSAAVLLLTILGVDRETVIQDYALTNVILKDSLDEKVAQSAQYDDVTDEELEAVFTTNGVNPDWMEHTFDYAEEQAGSMLEYIKQVYNITDEEIQLLRDKYLE